jgi:hypothetical protein
MKLMISYSGLVVAALCAAVLAGCNAVEDVRDEPFTPIPTQEVVLEGTIYGLGSKRSLVLTNNDTVTRSFLSPAPQPTPEGADPNAPSVTLFAFGNVKVGSAYKIKVKTDPYGKTCIVSNGSGVIGAEGASPAIRIDCGPSGIPRYSLTVSVPNAFLTLQGAKVTLTTEEAVREVTPTSANTTASTEPGFSLVTFPNALFTNPAGTALFDYTVSASTLEGGATALNPNRCGVTNPVNTVSVTAHVGVAPAATGTWPRVGLCTFTIGGNVGYSGPPTGTYTPTAITGLVLQLKDKRGAPLQDLPISTFTASAPALPATSNTVVAGVVTAPAGTQAYVFTYPARSNLNGIYEVAVKTQPTGQHCVVGTGTNPTGAFTSVGGVSLYQTSRTGIPVNVSTMNVRCRVRPALANQLTGTYYVTSGARFARTSAAVTTGTAPNTTVTTTVTDTTANYRPWTGASEFGCAAGNYNYTTVQIVTTTAVVNPAGTTTVTPGGAPTSTCDVNSFRVMLTFFDDGTFLLATHGAVNSVEQGFYAYDLTNPADKKLYITVIGTGGTPTSTANPVNGFRSTPGSVTVNGATHQRMYTVEKTSTTPPSGTHPRGVAGTITGRFGVVATPITNPPGAWATWTLSEAYSVPAQMTGSWVTKDHRRVWNYDFSNTYGYHVGVNGGATNTQDSCYTLDDYRMPSGFYTRRGALTGTCNPAFGGVMNLPGTAGGLPTTPAQLGGTGNFVGRMPGSEGTTGASPSAIYYHIGTPASFFTTADTLYFPTTDQAGQVIDLSWCTTEVFGVRTSLNDIPLDAPVYFCRHGAN